MSTLYVTELYAQIRQSSRTLIVSRGKEKLAQVPMIRLDNILIYGNAQLSTQAMAAVLEEGIDVTFLSPHGKLRGRLSSVASKNIILRLAQYERYLDDDFQIDMARIIVKTKLRNGRKMIQRFLQNHPDMDMRNELDLIQSTTKKVDRQQTIASLMGSEGIATAAYFKAYGKMFLADFIFEARSRRPPKDPVNALLSFGYTLLTNEILTLIHAHGLDPHIGFLHGIVYGRPSLALDLVEEFRHPVIDRFVLRLINRKILKKDDFEKRDNGIFLTEKGRKTFFHFYDKLLKQPAGKAPPLILRDILKRQVRLMAAAIKNRKPYIPHSFRL